MRFDELDQKMRRFETAHDFCVLPGVFIVVRIDGRNFTRLTKELQQFEAPFDVRFRDCMVETTKHLMDCGFTLIYGYTQSDEISLLFHPKEESFARKLRKLTSILAGEASAAFSLQLGAHAAFDARVSQLPRVEDVMDYFRWRNEDAHRNALNGHCYWHLRKRGMDVQEATARIEHMTTADKNELLFQSGINFNDIPMWQKRGIGLYWETYEKEGFNPKKGSTVTVERNRLRVDMNLPMKEQYETFILNILGKYTGEDVATGRRRGTSTCEQAKRSGT